MAKATRFFESDLARWEELRVGGFARGSNNSFIYGCKEARFSFESESKAA